MRKNGWSEKDIQYIKDNYGKLKLSEMGEHVGKTAEAVDAKLRRLGVPRMPLGKRQRQLALEGKHHMQTVEQKQRITGNKNPSCKPEVKEKLSQIRKAEYKNGTNRCGWKGPQRVPTDAEQSVMGGLTRLGFVWNNSISTGRPAKDGNHYMLDFSNKEFKICIEIDGSSHRGKIKQDRDRRKDEFLTDNGWIVLRFTNEQVLLNPAKVIVIIKDIVNFTPGKQAEAKDRVFHN